MDATDDHDVSSLLAQIEDLKGQLEQYKMLAVGNERRILDYHNECLKKDEEIAYLKEKLNRSNDLQKDSQANKVGEVGGEEEELLRKLFIGGLNYTTTKESLQEHFSQFGTVTDSIVMTDTKTGKSRGFGFVIFSTTEGVDNAQANRPHEIDNRVVETKRAVPRGESNKNSSSSKVRRIFIGGLKTTTDENTLYDYFSQYGHVDHVDLPEDKTTKRKRGFGYVAFNDSDPVDKVTIMKYHMIDGRKCEVKKAMTKSEMGTMKGPGKSENMGGDNFLQGNMHPGQTPNAGNMGGGFFPPGPNIDPQTMAMNYAACMASLMAMNGGMMPNVPMPGSNMMGNMAGNNSNMMPHMAGSNSNMMPHMAGNNSNMMPHMGGNNSNMMPHMGGPGGNMGGGGGGANVNMSPSGHGGLNYLDNPGPRTDPGGLKMRPSHNHRSSGPYGGGYGFPGGRQQMQ